MSMLEKIKAISKEEIYVEILMKSPVQLTPLTGNIGLQNRISDKNLHRPQLALAGFVELFTYHRVQIFGNTELYYLQSLQIEDRISAFENISRFSIPCIIITNNHQIDNSRTHTHTHTHERTYNIYHIILKLFYYAYKCLHVYTYI